MTEKETQTESGQIRQIPKATLAAAAFFAAVVLLTGYFFYRNMSLDSSIESEKKHAADYETSIASLQNDPSVQAAEILAKAKPQITKDIESSIVSNYVRELDRIHRDYLIQFSGFAYQDGKVTTSVTADKGLADDAIRKVIKLIGDYRSGTATGSLLLNPVAAVNGDSDKRTFGVEFKTK